MSDADRWKQYEAEQLAAQRVGNQRFVRALPWMLLGQLGLWVAYFLLRSRLGHWPALAVAAAAYIAVMAGVRLALARRRASRTEKL